MHKILQTCDDKPRLHTLFRSIVLIVLTGTGCTPSENSSLGPQSGPLTISGVIRFDGPRPARHHIDTRADAFCASLYADKSLLSDTEIVDAEGGVANVFVYIQNPRKRDYPVPETPVLLDQIACRFVPHVMGLRVGQQINFISSDSTLHTVRTLARINKPINLAQPGPGTRSKTFQKAEPHMKVQCDPHPWMHAYLFVMNHPFFAVTDDTGAFTIKNVPPGKYTLTAWHETFGELKQTVDLRRGAPPPPTFTFQPPPQ